MVCLWYMNTTHKHTVQFSKKDIISIQSIIHKGKHHARVIARARILPLTRQGRGKDAIAVELAVGRSTVQRTRDHYREGKLPRALYDASRPGQPPKLDEKADAHLIALACADPPKGTDRWTLELLRNRMIKDGKVASISTVAIWNRLKKRGIKPWREKNVAYSPRHA